MSVATHQLLNIHVQILDTDRFGNANNMEVLAQVDVTVPSTVALCDIIDEVNELAGIPPINAAWEATTAAGQPLDGALALADLGVAGGDLIVFAPQRARPAPKLKDAAEALEDITTTSSTHGLATFVSLIGFFAVALASAVLLPPAVLFIYPLLAFLLLMRLQAQLPTSAITAPSNPSTHTDTSAHTMLSIMVVALTAWAAAATVSGDPFALVHQFHAGDQVAPWWPWALFAAAVATGVATGALALLPRKTHGQTTVVAACITAAISLLFAASGSLFGYHDPSVARVFAAAGGATIAGNMLVLSAAPRVAIAAAGLRVPRLPTAGQRIDDAQVGESQKDYVHNDARALIAADYLAGVHITIATTTVCAALAVAGVSSGFSLALCVALTGAVTMHAIRHRDQRSLWALWVLAALSIAAVVLATATLFTHTSVYPAATQSPQPHDSFLIQVVIVLPAALLAVLSCIAPLLVAKVRDISPTQLGWLERLETLAVAAALPLALHHMGVFALIRGLG